MARSQRLLTAIAVVALVAACAGNHTVLPANPSPGPATAATATTTASTAPTSSSPASTPAPATTPARPGAAATTLASPPTRPTAGAHVMVIILENREADQVTGSSSAPNINALASRYGQATQVYATTHPSLPNYLELIAGTTFGITSDCTSCSVEGTTLVDQLTQAGIGWRAYMEGISAPCPTTPGSNGYAKKHDPFVYVRHLAADSKQCGRVVPFDRLAGDLQTGTDPFVWITPNLCHDGHDCSTATMDTWVGQTMQMITASAWYAAGGRVIITFDEGSSSAGCCGGAHGGHIATVVVRAGLGPAARIDAPLDQAGILRSIEDHYGLGHLGDAGCPCSGSIGPLLG
jgi:hypothetical protein